MIYRIFTQYYKKPIQYIILFGSQLMLYVRLSNAWKLMQLNRVSTLFFLMNPTVIVKSDTSTGAFNSAIQISNYESYSDDAKIFLTTNNLDYYINLMNANNKAAICMYISSSNSLSCIDLPSIQGYSIGSLMLNDNQLFLMGQDISTITLLHIFKVTFSTATYNWASQISCSSDCSLTYAESIQSIDSSKIYQNPAIKSELNRFERSY